MMQFARKLVALTAVLMLAGACSASPSSEQSDDPRAVSETEGNDATAESTDGDPAPDPIDDTNAAEVVEANVDDADSEGEVTPEEVKILAKIPTIEGPLTVEAFDAQMNQRDDDLRSCYAQLLETEPDASGEIAINLTVTASGAVESTDIESEEIDDEVFDECVKAAVVSMEFGEMSSSSVVIVAFDFSRK